MPEQSWIITTAVGTGEKGYAGDGGPAARALLNGPFDVGFDARPLPTSGPGFRSQLLSAVAGFAAQSATGRRTRCDGRWMDVTEAYRATGDQFPCLREDMLKKSEVKSLFRRRPAKPVNSAGYLAWAADEDVDLDYHFRHSALPQPGRVRELLELTSRWHSTLLDRHRPLWEIHLVEGLRDGRFAVCSATARWSPVSDRRSPRTGGCSPCWPWSAARRGGSPICCSMTRRPGGCSTEKKASHRIGPTRFPWRSPRTAEPSR